jgi:16S rRNA G1207 methylase RsmC
MSHYFTDDELGETHDVSVAWLGKTLTFLSASGVFSKDRLDTGTRLLIEESDVPANSRVLDLGCGIGVVGILLKLRDESLSVTQSDVTDKAVMLSKVNSKRLRARTRVLKSDLYEAFADERFDVILCNPPRAAGKAVIARMITGAREQLVFGGSLQIVAMTNKGGESYAKMMNATFGNVHTIARGSGYKVYKSVSATPLE